MSDVRTCTATTQSGAPCRARARPGRERCAWHDETLDDQRAAWAKAGGHNRSNAIRIKRALPAGVAFVSAALLQAITDVVAGKLHPTRGNAVASLARAYLVAHAAGEVELRLAEIEGRLAEREAA